MSNLNWFKDMLHGTVEQVASVSNLGSVQKQKYGSVIINGKKRIYVNLDPKQKEGSMKLRKTKYSNVSFINVNPQDSRMYYDLKDALLSRK